ncbi:hypothetical protein MN608_00758 [Microdochium nivale]|nr:hypothetical protein MN608_00758 [Microdochium nivale]
MLHWVLCRRSEAAGSGRSCTTQTSWIAAALPLRFCAPAASLLTAARACAHRIEPSTTYTLPPVRWTCSFGRPSDMCLAFHSPSHILPARPLSCQQHSTLWAGVRYPEAALPPARSSFSLFSSRCRASLSTQTANCAVRGTLGLRQVTGSMPTPPQWAEIAA